MFNTSISGLNASQKYLDTTSNNIANSNSYGFKKSRAEFADIYSNSVFTSSKTATGMGATTTTVAQQFTQGSLSGDTGNNLDMAISGNGFFVLANEPNDSAVANNGDRTYTRNGAFEINKDGYIVTAMGDYLQGYTIDKNGNTSNLDLTSTKAIQIPSDTGAPKMSTRAGIDINLPAGAEALATSTATAMSKFDHTDSSTYTNATSQTIYDSLGGAHTLTYYFVKDHVNDGSVDPTSTATPPATYPTDGNTVWNVVAYVDGHPVDMADAGSNAVEYKVTDAGSADVGETFYGMQLTFGTDGKLIDNGQKPANVVFTNDGTAYPQRTGRAEYTLAATMGGAVSNDQSLSIDMDFTQYGSSKFSVSNITNDGYSTGVLENVQVDENGIIIASYSNGRTEMICKVAMANFSNPQGLIKIGDTQWKESVNSGQAQACEANSGMAGAIKGANLELSNVELASELVDLIIAQRSYQANAQALQTQNTAMDSIMNIR
ncbi:MAG: flagellar hook protein FlgE [Succinivibrio sp.]